MTKARTDSIPKLVDSAGGRIRDFLEKAGTSKDVSAIIGDLLRARAEYERCVTLKSQWWSYKQRSDDLGSIRRAARDLSKGLRDLDIISRADLAARLGSERLEAMIGSLGLLGDAVSGVAETVQKDGKPRDLAEERWIHSVADIYEGAFSRKATVSGPGSGPARFRGRFYQLLEVSRPSSLRQYGKLTPRQVMRALARRRGRYGVVKPTREARQP